MYILRKLLICVTLLFAGSVYADLPDFATLVEKNAPAVVNVQATRTGESPNNDSGDDVDTQDVPEIFRKFFGPNGPNGPGGRRGPQIDGTRVSLGSGFIISADG